MIKVLEKEILGNWTEYGREGIAPRRLGFLMSHKFNKVRFGVFADGHQSPVFFAKTVRHKSDSEVIISEFERLKTAESALAEEKQNIIPTLFDLLRVDGHPVLLTEFVDGRKLAPSLDDFENHLDTASMTLTKIGLSSRKDIESSGNFEGLVEEDVRVYLSYYPEHGEGKVGETIRMLLEPAGLSNACGSTVLMHGDFGLNNLLVGEDGAIYVTDWEHSPGYGLPLYDLVFFVIHYVWYYLRHYSNEFISAGDPYGVLSYSLGPKSPIRGIVWERICRYCENMGLEESLAIPMVLYSFIRTEVFCRKGLWGEIERGEWMRMVDTLAKKHNDFCVR